MNINNDGNNINYPAYRINPLLDWCGGRNLQKGVSYDN
jgi:hypothetical protein